MEFIKHVFGSLIAMLLLTACGTTKTVQTTPETAVGVPKEVPSQEPVTPDEETPTAVVTNNSSSEKEVEEMPEETPKEAVNLENPEAVATSPEVFTHVAFNELLQKHVNAEGFVDYAGFKSDRSALRNYIATLGENMPSENWSREAKLAYWMNAYNAMTIDLILRHQPLESIKDIKRPWEQRYWKLGEKYYNLDEIEHQILRKMGEPRIHFGINCASFSCPPLLNTAFSEAAVDDQLDTLARRFINDKQRNTLTAEMIEISKIFDWFGKDFENEGSLISYLNQYATVPIASSAKIRYKKYNWELNDQ